METPTTLRLLLLEDDPLDAELEITALEESGYRCRWTRVETRQDFLTQLDTRAWDVVLADFNLPTFDGLRALRLFLERRLDLPFILVSGNLGEETAIESLKAGATDYVLKNRLSRLGLAVQRALREKAEQRQRREAEEEIRRRNRELALLNRIIAASAAGVAPEAILDTACRELAQAFEGSHACGGLLPPIERSLVIVAECGADGRHEAPMVRVDLGHDDEALAWMRSLRTPCAFRVVVPDGPAVPIRRLTRRRETQSILLIPLAAADAVAGVLWLEFDTPRDFTPQETDLASRVADQLTGAFSRALLDRERRRLSGAVDQVAEAVTITDTDGRIVYVNPAFERMTRFAHAEIIGQVSTLLDHHGTDAAGTGGAIWSAVEAGQVWQGRLVTRRKDGTAITTDTTFGPVRDEHGGVVNFVCVQRDVTEELQLEQQYRQAQKMEAIGRLAGGVAHDFNNLLTAIVGYTQLLIDRTPPDSDLRRDLGQIDAACERATSLVRSLLTFSRRDATAAEVHDLNVIVRNVSRLLERVIGEDVEIAYSLASDLQPVHVDAGQLEQVLMNLAVNARDAMPDGGRLVVETRNVTVSGRNAPGALDMMPGQYVRLSVTDTGVGMDEQVISHLFEPFFTTKAAGEGTGLGLSIVYGVAKRHNGHIAVDSQPGQGTTFRVYLPAHTTPADVSPAAPEAGRPDGGLGPGGREGILVVEDEAPVRMLIQRALEAGGYRVLPAPDATTALALFRQHRSEIVLLLTDVVMPDMDGPALFDTLSQQAPHLKVLFLSGYAGETVRGRGVLKDAPFLQKPFKLVDLSRTVRDVLDRPGACPPIARTGPQ